MLLYSVVVVLCLVGVRARITEEDCEDSEYHINPDNCPAGYFRCSPNSQGGWTIEENTCPDGTGFNPAIQTCDWLANLPDNICEGVTHPPTTEPPPTTAPPANQKILGCYFGAWSVYRPGLGSFDVDDIDPQLCTHLFYGFANMDNTTWEVYAYDPWYDLAPDDEGCDGDHCHWDSYRRFNRLKESNPRLKTMLSIGGWNTGSGQWSEMAVDPAKRAIFIGSAVEFAKRFGFDGIDFDWEYPGSRQGSHPEYDREDFTALIEEFGEALHSQGLILTAATSPNIKTMDVGVDLPRVMAHMDFINVMDYDYHGAWDNFTGHNSPIFGRTDEEAEEHPGHTLNLNDTISWYLSEGAPREKLVIGTAIYGRGLVLQTVEENGLYCPAAGGIPMGPYSRQDGFWGYYEILQAFNNDTLNANLPDATPKGWTVVRDGCYMAPYAYNGPYWIGYDDTESITKKAQFVNTMGVGGAMVFSIDYEDFRGDYGAKNPITSTLKRVMASGETMDILGENSGCESAPICDI